jgi:hypothetical protein
MNSKRALVGLLSLVLAACGGVHGSGTSQTEERQVGEFTRLQVAHALKVKLTDRDPRSVVVTADDNLVPLILTEVKEGALIVSVKDGAHLAPVADLSIEVSGRELNWLAASGAASVESGGGLVCEMIAVDVSGAASVTLDSVAGSQLWVRASGASSVKVRSTTAGEGHVDLSGASSLSLEEGKLDTLAVKASGASQLTARGLAVKTVTVDLSGASEAALQASEGISGTATGASSVTVAGAPAARSIEVSGGSTAQFE